MTMLDQGPMPRLPDAALLQHRREVAAVLRAVAPGVPVVLVGSWARGRQVADISDIDLLVLAHDCSADAQPDVQVIAIEPDELERRALEGDDFAQWALRLGRPLSGRDAWAALKARLLPMAPWPRPEAKLAHAARKVVTARALLEMGDTAAATEEARYAASHLARGVLLAQGVFPLSRPELSQQLRDCGQDALAIALEATGVADAGHESVESVLRALTAELERGRAAAARS